MKNNMIKIIALVICAAVFAGTVVLGRYIGASSNPSDSSQSGDSGGNRVGIGYDAKEAALHTDRSVAVIVRDDEPSYMPALEKRLKRYGFGVDVYDWAAAEAAEAEGDLFSYGRYRVIIYTDAAYVPTGLISGISSYLRAKGGLICIGGPAFTEVYEKSIGGYVFSHKMKGSKYADNTNERDGELQIDCMAPSYQTYPITNAAELVSRDTQAILSVGEYDSIPEDVFSPSPRTMGGGIGKLSSRRFIPLIEALDEKGAVAGYPAYMYISSDIREAKNGGGIWAGFNTNDEAFLGSKQVTAAIACAAAYINERTMLYGGGADEYAYFPGDTWTLGAETVSEQMMFVTDQGSQNNNDYGMKVTVERDGETLYERTYSTYELDDQYDTPIGIFTEYNDGWKPEADSGVFTVRAELYKGDTLMDVVSHGVTIYRAEPAAERSFVTSVGNDMYLDGRIWKCYGVNYMPSTCIALTGDDYERWMSAAAYEPSVVENDLRHIKDIGFNAVSMFIYYEWNKDNNNIAAFLSLCEKYDLKVFLSIRPCLEPMYYSDEKLRQAQEIITKFGLAENDTLIGYDIAWETMPTGYDPSWCNTVGRRVFDGDWTNWIIDNYGSIDAAEEAWNFKLDRRNDGTVGGLDALNIVKNGNRAAVNAYRRWLDDWTAEIHSRVSDGIKDVDPNHMISFRMGMYTGWANARAYDLGWEYSALASSLDAMGPEGYGYYSKWDDDFETALFSVVYSRYSCEKPVIWFEFGYDSWSGTNYVDDESGRQEQLGYYKYINRVLTESRSNGIFYWWYAGGYRMGEGSDYGIINPDGSDREVTTLLREFASEFLNGAAAGKPDSIVTVESDSYAKGVVGVYKAVRSDFRAAQKEKKMLGLTDPADGTTSLNTPVVRLNGSAVGPLRNLNADIRRVYYRTDGNPEWKLIDENGEISVRKGEKVYFRLTVSNTGRASWICRANAGTAAGAVGVTLNGESFALAADVGRHETAEAEGMELTVDGRISVVLQMSAEGRARFGEKFRFDIKLGG